MIRHTRGTLRLRRGIVAAKLGILAGAGFASLSKYYEALIENEKDNCRHYCEKNVPDELFMLFNRR